MGEEVLGSGGIPSGSLPPKSEGGKVGVKFYDIRFGKGLEEFTKRRAGLQDYHGGQKGRV